MSDQRKRRVEYFDIGNEPGYAAAAREASNGQRCALCFTQQISAHGWQWPAAHAAAATNAANSVREG